MYHNLLFRCYEKKKEGLFKHPNNSGVKREEIQLEKEPIFIDLTDDFHDNHECISLLIRRRCQISRGNSSLTNQWSDDSYISSDSEHQYRMQSPIFLCSNFKV